jgi:phosphatidylglycerophosphate synthase
MRQPGLLNVPNVISLSRLLLAVIFVFAQSTQLRFTLLALAALTDVLDGLIARLSHTATRFGALIDAVADRAFVLTAVITVWAAGMLTVGEVLILASRDIATAIGFVVARIIPWLRRVAFKARLVGKGVTVLQFLVLAAALVAPVFLPFLILAVGVLSAIAIADYTLALWRGRATA